MKKIFITLTFLFISVFLFAENYFVCLGSFAREQNALNFQNELKQESIETFIEEATSKTGTKLFRVILDVPNAKIEDARKLRDEFGKGVVAQKLNLRGLWVLPSSHEKKVVALPSPAPVVSKPAANEIKLETNNDYPVSTENPYSLFIQSYKDEELANNDLARLKENNIDAYVLKKFRDNENFSFDIHAGSADSENGLENLKSKLDDLKINYETTTYNNFSDELKKYNDVVKSNNVIFDKGLYELPKSLNENVKYLINEFPVNKNFQLESLTLVDVQNVLKYKADQLTDFISEDDLLFGKEISAYSKAVYKDHLFDKTIVLNVLSYEKDISRNFEKVFSEKEEQEDFVKQQDFVVNGQTINSWIFKTTNGYFLTGFIPDKKIMLSLVTEDLSEDELHKFIENSFNDSELIIYPQIRKTLCVLPENNANNLLVYSLSSINLDYVEAKNGATWAWGIFGHWNSAFTFYDGEKEFSVSLFDLDYDYNAENVHQIFMEEKNESYISDENHPCAVKDKNGWYLETYEKELSFSNKSYIISIDADIDSTFTENDFVEIANNLKIWN